MAFVTIAGTEFQILNKLGGGGFSRVYEVLGPDKVIRAVKMVNTLGMEGEVNKEELRSHGTVGLSSYVDDFRELKILRSLESVPKVAQLICHDVVYSQEGVLLMVVMEKGEISLSKYLEHDASSSDTEMSTFFSGDDATQQTLSRDPTELRKVQISIEGLAILTLGAGEK